jgi:hypothetical protein
MEGCPGYQDSLCRIEPMEALSRLDDRLANLAIDLRDGMKFN